MQGVLRSLASLISPQRLTEDRRVLEQIILPAYARRSDMQRVLFVGCAAYTKQYGQLFADREYWTIDPVEHRRRYGSSRHIVDRLENLGDHVSPDYFDVVICNGVLGWGLNALNDVDAAFGACHRHLRNAGELVLGWNDVAPHNRVAPSDVPSLKNFAPLMFEPLNTSKLELDVPHRHIFEFYLK
ncbi:MAG: methyltransferase domain-containing protein [Burkholderiaceae bacterium]